MPYHSTIGSAGSSLFVRKVRFGSQGHLTLKANLLSRVKPQEGLPRYIQKAQRRHGRKSHGVIRLHCWLLTQVYASTFAEVRHSRYVIRQSATAESYRLSANHRLLLRRPAAFYAIIVGRRKILRSCIKPLQQMQARQRLVYRILYSFIHVPERHIYWLLICCIVITSHTIPLTALSLLILLLRPYNAYIVCTASELKPRRARITDIESAQTPFTVLTLEAVRHRSSQKRNMTPIEERIGLEHGEYVHPTYSNDRTRQR